MKRFVPLVLCVAAACAKAAQPAPELDPAPAARGSLAQQLAAESAARPAAGPRAEDVVASLGGAAGKQVLARPVLARYCYAGRTAAGLGVAVCQYDSEAAARRGLDHSHRTFDRLVPNRTLAVHGPTLLTVTEPTENDRSDAERLIAQFQTM